MISFKTFCEALDHKSGTYSAVYLQKDSAKKLLEFLKKNNISASEKPSKLHTTIVYSRVGIPEASVEKVKLPLEAKIIGWEVFNTQSGSKCLVARMEQKPLQKLHDMYYKNYSKATYDFPEYKPHITVNTDYNGSIPKALPDFPIIFDKHYFGPVEE